MNIRKIINEIITEDLQIKNIQKECSDFIKENIILYHGTTKKISNNITKIDYDNTSVRVPKDTPKYIDNWIEELRLLYNPSAVSRRKAVFVTGVEGQAHNYGKSYYFIPCNGYKVSSNQNVYDLYTDIGNHIDTQVFSLIKKYEKLNYPYDLNRATDFHNFRKKL